MSWSVLSLGKDLSNDGWPREVREGENAIIGECCTFRKLHRISQYTAEAEEMKWRTVTYFLLSSA